MARTPNYRFERSERDRQKAAKKADRLAAKRDKNEAKEGDENETETEAPEVSDD